ncbi:excalibur calcium-binding domain-containing protein [Streptomyces sp. NPDC086835]|uniref:excalibur calcium-binding domain-containing protein n=1 Tax=Streptomyces sp. NPDC086835 TaxID=3365761 RepID=UPI003817E8CF
MRPSVRRGRGDGRRCQSNVKRAAVAAVDGGNGVEVGCGCLAGPLALGVWRVERNGSGGDGGVCCRPVRTAGAAPILRGGPGNAKRLDRDGGGIGRNT